MGFLENDNPGQSDNTVKRNTAGQTDKTVKRNKVSSNLEANKKQINKRFFKYVSQSVLGMIGMSVYILADTFFISKYAGADGLTILNLALPIYGLMFALGAIVGTGTATRYAILKASGKNADTYFLQALMWDIFISIPFILCGIFCPDKVLTVLGADSNLTKMGMGYIRIILIFSPLFIMNNCVTTFIRNDNGTTVSMTGLLSGSTFNIIFDYVFMFIAGLGLNGAALATAFSPGVTMLVCTLHLFGKKNTIVFKASKPDIKLLIRNCSLGVAAFVGEISSCVTTLVFNFMLLKISGNTAVAAYGVIANISLVGMSIFNGISQGIQPLISESYGRGEAAEVKKYYNMGMVVTAAFELLIVALAWFMTDPLIKVFNSENNKLLQSYAHTGMRMYFLGFLLVGLNIMRIAYFAASDKPLPVMAGSLLRGIVAISLSGIVLGNIFGMQGIWISLLVSEALTFVVIHLKVFNTCSE